MSGTYRVSGGNAAYLVGFSLVWCVLFGGFVIPHLPHDAQPQHLLAHVAVLAFALAPALVTARLTYEVTLTDMGELDCRSLLRRRRVRAQQIRALEWDEEYIYLKHDRGKVTLIADKNFAELLARVLELNPGITADDAARRSIGVPN